MAILGTEKVLTFDYWKFARDIVPGDVLFNSKGDPATVKSVQVFQATECYEVLFKDELTVAGDANLSLPAATQQFQKQIRGLKRPNRSKQKPKQLSAFELHNGPLTGRQGRLEYAVGTVNAIQLPTQPLPIPPFAMGLWFFNRIQNKQVSVPTKYYEYAAQKLQDAGYKVGPPKRYSALSVRFSLTPWIGDQLKPLTLHAIPNNYLMGSAEQRLELLRGIMAGRSRSYSPQTKNFQFGSRFASEMRMVQFLVESLGGKTKLEHKPQRSTHTVFFSIRLEIVPDQIVRPIRLRQHWRLIKEVYEIQPQQCIHIEIDGDDPNFLVGEGFISCH